MTLMPILSLNTVKTDKISMHYVHRLSIDSKLLCLSESECERVIARNAVNFGSIE